jgi:hypothetical protein
LTIFGAPAYAPTLISPFTPPPFSQNITSIFPGAPFVTCLQGQFEPSLPPPQPPPVHIWFVKAKATGQLTIDVRAVTVNTAEAGSIIANFFDPTIAPPPPPTPMPPAASVTVIYPTVRQPVRVTRTSDS